jgi:hypothetical protein
MSVFVWSMIGIAFWHFTILVPDRFAGGIIGAFLAAWAGALASGMLLEGFAIPKRQPARAAARALRRARFAHRFGRLLGAGGATRGGSEFPRRCVKFVGPLRTSSGVSMGARWRVRPTVPGTVSAQHRAHE